MEKWYILNNFRCPVAGCEGGRVPCKWICEADRSLIKIAQTGYMKCSHNAGGRAAHYGKICMWRWDCGRHGDHPFNRFQEADFQGFVFALSHAVQLTTTAGATWVATLCAELEKQYKSGEAHTPVDYTDFTFDISEEETEDDYWDGNTSRIKEAQTPVGSSNGKKENEKSFRKSRSHTSGSMDHTSPSNPDRTCSICQERNVDAFLIPCGHTLCMQDALELQKHSKQCHICRQTFTSVKKLYF